MASLFKKTKVELELLKDPNMLLMFEEAGITQSSHRYSETNNKYMKNYDKNKESSFLIYLDGNNLYGGVMSQKLLTSCFNWVKNVSKIDETFFKNCDNDDDIGYIIK